MKKISALFMIFTLFFNIIFVKAVEIDKIESKSYILLDGKTGNVLLEKNADEKLPPASITKIMTMLLAVEAIERGDISVDDIVTVSETAAKHEGSHVFLAVNEKISVNDLLKAIAVASGNDAAMAMAEFVGGTQENFVDLMNKRAKELGMNNTNFVNCNGLDIEGHLTTARDIGIMTCELLKHPMIFDYTTIWIDSLRNGKFQLSNTNKLIRFYEGANGMKTGSTSKAGNCISATALRNGVQLAAVIMNAPTSKKRFSDASTLLNYGFDNFSNISMAEKGEKCAEINVKNGVLSKIPVVYEKNVEFLVEKSDANNIKEVKKIPKEIKAPIEKEQIIGEVIYKIGEREVERVNIVAEETIDKTDFLCLFNILIDNLLICV